MFLLTTIKKKKRPDFVIMVKKEFNLYQVIWEPKNVVVEKQLEEAEETESGELFKTPPEQRKIRNL